MNACSLRPSSSAAVKMRMSGAASVHARDPLRRRDQHERRDLRCAPGPQHLGRDREGTTGREHRVDDVGRPAGEVVGQPLEVRDGPMRGLVAPQPDDTDLGVGQGREHAVEQAEAGAQDRHNERPGHRRAAPARANPAVS